MYFEERLRDNPAEGGDDVTRKLGSILSCNFENLSSYLEQEQRNNIGFPRNSKLWRWCRHLADRIVLLVRDPRATVHSRAGVSWCQLGECQNVTLLCTDLVQDFYSYQQLSSTFGEDKITYVRSYSLTFLYISQVQVTVSKCN